MAISDSRVAKRYARSLLSLAKTEGKLDEVMADMQLIDKVTADSPDLRSALANPILSSDKKLNVLTAIFKGKVADLTMRFISLVSQKNRESELVNMAKEAIRLNQEAKGLVAGEVTTVMLLDDTLRTQFRQLVRDRMGKDVELEEKIDPTLLGGYILRVGDQQIDESLRTKLQRLERNFKDNSFKAKV